MGMETAAAAHGFGATYGGQSVRSWGSHFMKTSELPALAQVVDYSLVHVVPTALKSHAKKQYLLTDDPQEVIKVLPPSVKPVVLVVHDKITCTANDGKTYSWMLEGWTKLRKKGQGRGIHRSDFLCSTFSHLADVVQIEHGKNHDGFWTGELMLDQVKTKLILLFEQLHPGQRMLLLLDNSQGHSFFAKDALRATKMNLNPGGVEARLQPDWYEKERGLWIDGLRGYCKKMVEHRDHTKCCTHKGRIKYYCHGLKRTIPAALKFVKLSTIWKFEQRTMRWVQAYLEGNVVDASYGIKQYSSHGRVPEKAASRDDYYFAD
ncbi:hypothetical protein BT69DRAFT_1292342 [Atractiella rhizophila]|nr:hypothetical protein BT69DRAFT_1292342 [Atractiella rhizophila]